MNLVNTETGELVESVSLEKAKQITEQIKLLAGAVADGMDRLIERIHEAQTSRVHEVLGYRSWTEYVSTEFANLLPRLGREPRRELVATLAESGMSTRAIAPVAGVSEGTVRSDQKQVRNSTHLPQTPEPSTGREATAGSGQASVTPITGRDGKTYNRPPLRSVPKPEPVVTQADHDFWNDAAEKAKASGYIARRDAEAPYVGAVIDLTYAAEQVAKVHLSPEDIAAHLPNVSRNRLPEIEAAATWLARFITATKENT